MDYHHHARLTMHGREQLAKSVVEGRLSPRSQLLPVVLDLGAFAHHGVKAVALLDEDVAEVGLLPQQHRLQTD